MDDLVEREGIYYEKFTDIPFTSEVTVMWPTEFGHQLGGNLKKLPLLQQA